MRKKNTFKTSTEYIGLRAPEYVARRAGPFDYHTIAYIHDFDFRSFTYILTADFVYSFTDDLSTAWISHYNLTSLNAQTVQGDNLDAFFDCLLSNYEGNICVGILDLDFWGPYIIEYILAHDFEAKKSPRGLNTGDMFCMISESSKHLYYTAKFSTEQQITFINLKNTFRLKEEELYDAYDIDASAPLCEALMRALVDNFYEGLYGTTLALNALKAFKRSITGRVYDFNFDGEYSHPYARKAFYGGFCYANPKYKSQVLYNVWGYDVNSMYPDAMLHAPMPYGNGMFYLGDVSKYAAPGQLYIQHLYVSFYKKDDGVPTVYRDRIRMAGKTHPDDSHGESRELYLTNWDMELLKDNYIIINIKYIDGVVYLARAGAYNEDEDLDGEGSFFFGYIHKYRRMKETGSPGQRMIAKNMLNTLYGAFGRQVSNQRMLPGLEDGCANEGLYFLAYDIPDGDAHGLPRYCELSCFISAWSRYKLVSDIKPRLDSFIYCDTDSLYLTEEASGLQLDRRRIGAYKCDKHIDRMYVVGSKRYIWEGRMPDRDGVITWIACSGATPDILKQMSFDNFRAGTLFIDNTIATPVKGGVIKKGYPFLLSEDSL